MEERELLRLRGRMRGAQYQVDLIRGAVMNVIFEAKGLRGDELFKRATQIDIMLETLTSSINEVKHKVDEEIDNLPKE